MQTVLYANLYANTSIARLFFLAWEHTNPAEEPRCCEINAKTSLFPERQARYKVNGKSFDVDVSCLDLGAVLHIALVRLPHLREQAHDLGRLESDYHRRLLVRVPF